MRRSVFLSVVVAAVLGMRAGVVAGNSPPVAYAGSSRYAGSDSVVLDGTGSFDPDGHGQLTYQWRQVSGPSVTMRGEGTAMLLVKDFLQKNMTQRCLFELTVSDGDLVSSPDTTEVIIVPYFGEQPWRQENAFDPLKPTIVAFGGGNCNTGGRMSFDSWWLDRVNMLTVDEYGKPYNQYAAPLIVYLSSLAPDYSQMIQTTGFSTGNMPAIDVAIEINKTYADRRYNVNRVSFLDAACRNYSSSISQFLASSVEGETCWIDSYFATHGRYYNGVLNIQFPAPPATHGTPYSWYEDSHGPTTWPGGNMFNHGLTAGYFLSLIGPGRNLRLAEDTSPYYFRWNSATGYLQHYNAGAYPGLLPEPVTLLGPEDGAVVSSNGVVLSCELSANAVSYQLLFGANPQQMNYVISETPAPPNGVVSQFPFARTYWTVRAVDAYGSTIFADPRWLDVGDSALQLVQNTTKGLTYNSIQDAIDQASRGDEIVVRAGGYEYVGDINFKGKSVTVRSSTADTGAAVIRGTGRGPAVTFSGGEDSNCLLSGFTVTGGDVGVYCYDASPTIADCTIAGNADAGAELFMASDPNLMRSRISDNNGPGMRLNVHLAGRDIHYNRPTLTNCIVEGNQGRGIHGYRPTVSNSTIVGNDLLGIDSTAPMISNSIVRGNNDGGVQVRGSRGAVTYSNVQGGFSGEGNIDADPCFADESSGDYRLKSQAGRWDYSNSSWVCDDVTSPCIDAGDPNSDCTAELWPHGRRINMGAYGGTAEASMSLSDIGNIADCTNDGLVNEDDLFMLVESWLAEDMPTAEDINRDGIVNFCDYAGMLENYLREE